MKPGKKNQRKHICELTEQGLQNWIQRLTDKAKVECRYCGVKANSLRNVCAVRLMEKIPEAEESRAHLRRSAPGRSHAREPQSDRSSADSAAGHALLRRCGDY